MKFVSTLKIARFCGATELSVDYPPLEPFAGGCSVRLESDSHTDPTLVVAPSAAYGPAKQWPLTKYLEVVQMVVREHWEGYYCRRTG